jgi:hypothetical protein
LVGFSHALHPAPRVEFFAWLRSKTFGAFIVVIFTLPIAVFIIVFHNQWQRRPAIVMTIAGWIMVVKCVTYAIFPSAFSRVAKKGASKKGIAAAGILAMAASTAILAAIYV